MTNNTKAQLLADMLERYNAGVMSQAICEDYCRAAAELRRLHHNNQVLMNALWKACGDDEEVVNATIESQGELK